MGHPIRQDDDGGGKAGEGGPAWTAADMAAAETPFFPRHLGRVGDDQRSARSEIKAFSKHTKSENFADVIYGSPLF